MYRCSPPLRRGLYTLTTFLYSQVKHLRMELSRRKSAGASPLRVLEIESQLAIELGNSSRPEEQEEALRIAEKLWELLEDPQTPITTPSRTAMRVMLCSTMRRCAVFSKYEGASEVWSQRFAQRASNIGLEDFMQNEQDMQYCGKKAGMWKSASQLRAEFGTSLTEEDMDSDTEGENAETMQKSTSEKNEGENHDNPKCKNISPIQKYRNNLLKDHPLLSYGLRRRSAPGPRYTG